MDKEGVGCWVKVWGRPERRWARAMIYEGLQTAQNHLVRRQRVRRFNTVKKGMQPPGAEDGVLNTHGRAHA